MPIGGGKQGEVELAFGDGVVVGQAAVGAKIHELTAIHPRLDNLEWEGRVVTLDTLSCQTTSTETIADAGGGYLLTIKNNQPDLRCDFAYFDCTGGTAGARLHHQSAHDH